MAENPFSELEDSDRTIIRPAPTGRRMPPPPAPPPARSPQAPAAAGSTAVDLVEIPAAYSKPLTAAAAPLVQLLALLRDAAAPPDLGDFRRRTVHALNLFEQRARDGGVAPEQLRRAHHAVCAAVDDAVLDTPWGGGWNPLMAEFHPSERGGAEGFLDLLRRTSREPVAFLPVIELMYVCLSVGFMGLHRASPSDQVELERLRIQTHALIAGQRRAEGIRLSPHWAGVSAPYRPGVRLPLWVVASAALASVAGLFVWSLHGLNAASDALYARMLDVPPAAMPRLDRAAFVRPPPPPPDPPEAGTADRLGAALRPEIEHRQLALLATASGTILRLSARALFAPDGAILMPGATALLRRVGAVLREHPGPVRVIGYTDSQPVRTVQFPSNFQLSAARADAVRTALVPELADRSRVTAEGRADADPIAANNTAEGREQNRRVDLVLQRQS